MDIGYVQFDVNEWRTKGCMQLHLSTCTVPYRTSCRVPFWTSRRIYYGCRECRWFPGWNWRTLPADDIDKRSTKRTTPGH